jgi:hypothetical protein
MSDSNRPPALPSPGGGGDQSGAATPGTTTARTFQPQRVATFRKDGISQTDAMAEIARRRAARPSARDVQVGRVPRQTPAARAPDPPVDGGAAFSPLQTADIGTPAPAPTDQHPLAPGPQLPNDPVFDLTIGGQPARVALSELVRGYMRHQDYTAKTQQNAALLKTAQDAHLAFDNARKQLEARLPAVIAAFGDEFSAPIDWVKLSREDPIGYTQKDARYKAWLAAQQEQANLQTLRNNESQLKKQEMMRIGHDFLSAVLPGWRDDATRKELQKAQLAHLRQVGYTDAEIDAYEMLDPRQVVILEESRRFRAIVAAHPELLRPQSDALRPQPQPQRETGSNGRQPRLPQAEVAAGEAERTWQDLGDEKTGARAREAAIDLIGARRRANRTMRESR